MKRLAPILTIAALFLFLLGMRVQAAQPAPIRQYAPIVAGAQAPPIVTLDAGDNTFVNAVVIPGPCVLLAYIDRDDGNRLKVKQDAGDHLIDVPLPPEVEQALIRAAPSFTAPGDKQADGTLLVYDNKLVMYYTSRPVDAPSGASFGLMRLTIPLPECA